MWQAFDKSHLVRFPQPSFLSAGRLIRRHACERFKALIEKYAPIANALFNSEWIVSKSI